MRAGKLRYRWSVQERTVKRNTKGEEVVEWTTVRKAWGSWDPLKGSESWSAQQFVERAVARVWLRFDPEITAMHRIHNDELGQFEIVGEPEQRRFDGETVLNVTRIVEQ